jgi:spermidine synthase
MKKFQITSFANIEIKDTYLGDEEVRMLLVDQGQESACFLNPMLRNELVFPYTKAFARVTELAPVRDRVLMLGGGAFSFPKFYISHYPEGAIDVVELHEEIYDIALDYFFLDELFETYDLKNTGRLKVHIQDAFAYIHNCRETYDLIFNDAYHGVRPDFKGLTFDTTAEIKKCLNESGIYILNLIGSMSGSQSMQTVLSKEILHQLFTHVEVVPVEPLRRPEDRQNLLLLASDSPLPDMGSGVLRRKIPIDDFFG